METIFDAEHKMTEEERVAVCGLTEEAYRKYITDSDSLNAGLFRLYDYRGEKRIANSYLSKIENKQTRLELTYVDITE